MSDLIVAKTILEQLGGQKFLAMTGAKNLIGSANSLSFKIGKNLTQANGVYIHLNDRDLYDVEFIRASVKGRSVLARHSDVPFDHPAIQTGPTLYQIAQRLYEDLSDPVLQALHRR